MRQISLLEGRATIRVLETVTLLSKCGELKNVYLKREAEWWRNFKKKGSDFG